MKHLFRAARLPHARNIVINTVGNYISLLFSAVYIVVLVRIFTPSEFGVLSILLALSYLLANVLTFGMPASIYAYVPKLLPDRKAALRFIFSNFAALTGLSAVSLCLIALFIPYLDGHFFKTNASIYLFLMALIGTQLFVWQNYAQDVLNAAGDFLRINIALNIGNVVRISLIGVLVLSRQVTITNILWIMLIIGPLSVLIYILAQRRWIIRELLTAKFGRADIKIGFTFTYFLATQMFQLATRADLFLVSYFLTRPEVGYYSLSQRIVIAVVTAANSITQVMSPEFARIRTQTETRRTLKHSFVYMLIPAGMFIGGIILPPFVYDFVFGVQYASSTIVTKLLSAAYIPFSFLAVVLLFFLYTVKKPGYVLLSNGLFLITIVGMDIALIPRFGLIAPALGYLVGFTMVMIVMGGLFWKEYRKLEK